MKYSGIVTILCNIALLVVLTVPAAADPLTFSFQEGDAHGYTGTYDTYLEPAEPDDPKGSLPYVFVDGDYQGAVRNDALIRFDGIFGAGANQVPLGAEIISATLTIYVPEPGDGTCGATIHRMLVPWNEDDTWNDWGDGVDADDNEAVSAFEDEIGDVTAGNWYDIDVTDSVQAWADGETNYGWVFLGKPISIDGWRFSTHEEATLSYRPELTVTIPEPSTLLLLASALLGFAGVLLKRRN